MLASKFRVNILPRGQCYGSGKTFIWRAASSHSPWTTLFETYHPRTRLFDVGFSKFPYAAGESSQPASTAADRIYVREKQVRFVWLGGRCRPADRHTRTAASDHAGAADCEAPQRLSPKLGCAFCRRHKPALTLPGLHFRLAMLRGFCRAGRLAAVSAQNLIHEEQIGEQRSQVDGCV